jgi:hypothetical protein
LVALFRAAFFEAPLRGDFFAGLLRVAFFGVALLAIRLPQSIRDAMIFVTLFLIASHAIATHRLF